MTSQVSDCRDMDLGCWDVLNVFRFGLVDVGDSSLHRRPSVDPVQTLDIEGMLNMATALSGKQIVKQAMEKDVNASQLRTRNSNSSAAEGGEESSRVRHWRAPSDVPADLTGSGTFSGYSVVMPNPFNDDHNVELPSPFIQADEPARPASDIIRPVSTEGKGGHDVSSNNEGPEKHDEGKRSIVVESREET